MNTPDLNTFHIQSPVGLWAVTTSELQVHAVDYLPASSAPFCREAETRLEQRVACMLNRYFKGEVIDFSKLPIAFPGSPESDWLSRVMKCLLAIPYGETHSYQWLAEQLGNPKAARAVGGAVGRNPIPIIVPCHRIIAQDQKIGGFMRGHAEGGKIKEFLLQLEGHRFVNGKRRQEAMACPR